MHTLNLVDNKAFEFNAFKVFDEPKTKSSQRKFALMEQLQTTLELGSLLNIFSMEVAKYIDFSGLSFKKGEITATMRGSRQGRTERHFELKLNNKFIGILSYAINSPISITNYKILEELHQYLIHPLNNAIEYQNILKLAMQDSLTSLGNRRYFDEQLKRAMHRASRLHSRVGLLVCDLNKFKIINDTHGHNVGDDVLTHFAQVLKECVRDSDSVFRFGGDEFAIIVEDADKNALTTIELRITEQMKNTPFLAHYQVTTSIGSTLMNRIDTQESLFERADKILYQRKFSMPNKLSII